MPPAIIEATNAIDFPESRARQPEAHPLDADLYLIVVRHPQGDYMPETDLSAATLDKVADEIWHGEHTAVAHVVRFNPIAGTSRVADAEIAELLSVRSHNESVTPRPEVIDLLQAFGLDFFEDAQFRADRRTYDREMARSAA